MPTSDETALPKEDDGESWLELLRDGAELIFFAEKHGKNTMESEIGWPLMNLLVEQFDKNYIDEWHIWPTYVDFNFVEFWKTR